MGFSEFLNTRRAAAKELVAHLRDTYEYASVLGVDVKARSISVNKKLTNISAGGDTECGFVVRAAGDGLFYEYSMDDIHGNKNALVEEILRSFRTAFAASYIWVQILSIVFPPGFRLIVFHYTTVSGLFTRENKIFQVPAAFLISRRYHGILLL